MTTTTFRPYAPEAFEADARFLVSQCEWDFEANLLIVSQEATDRFDQIAAVYGEGEKNMLSHLVARTLNSIRRDVADYFSEMAEDEKPTEDHNLGVDHEVYADVICGNQPYLISTCWTSGRPFQLGQTIHLKEYAGGVTPTGRCCTAEIGQVSHLPQPEGFVVLGLLNVKAIVA
jgi:hypothetical protein